ncbi:MAG: DUF2252 domain-containing protein [Kineosporiaceae bacterium]
MAIESVEAGGWVAPSGRAQLDPAGGSSVADRVQRGKAARREVPLDAHAVLDLPAERPSPVDTLLAQEVGRLPDLVPLRHARMVESPFAFLRGAAAVMADDLAHTAASGIVVQACGDAHAANFGVQRTPRGDLTVDVNDFDESLPAPFEWDVKRLAASLAVVGRERGFSTKERRAVVTAVVAEYRESLRRLAEQDTLTVWNAQVDVATALAELDADRRSRREGESAVRLGRAAVKDSLKAMARLTTLADGQRRFVADPPVLVPLDDLGDDVDAADGTAALRALLRGYRRSLGPDRAFLIDQFHLVQAARKVVGVGSVGTRCWVLLLLGRDDADALFLQVKEATTSVLEPVAGRSGFGNAGQRVVSGQRLMQAHPDGFLGWARARDEAGTDRDYYVRQLWDARSGFDLMSGARPAGLERYGRLCAWTLARAHARSGDRVALAAYLGGSPRFERAVAMFAEAYADQTESDWHVLKQACADGALPVAGAVG